MKSYYLTTPRRTLHSILCICSCFNVHYAENQAKNAIVFQTILNNHVLNPVTSLLDHRLRIRTPHNNTNTARFPRRKMRPLETSLFRIVSRTCAIYISISMKLRDIIVAAPYCYKHNCSFFTWSVTRENWNGRLVYAIVENILAQHNLCHLVYHYENSCKFPRVNYD